MTERTQPTSQDIENAAIRAAIADKGCVVKVCLFVPP